MATMPEPIEGHNVASMAIHLTFSAKTTRERHNLQETTPGGDIGPQKDNSYAQLMDSGSDDDDSDDDDDDYDDEILIFRAPSPAQLNLDADSRLARYRRDILRVAMPRFYEFRLQVLGQKITRMSALQPCSLPCPFYARNPCQHRACLRHNLQRPIDVKRHLWTSHRQRHGYECPMCGNTFETGTACDAHIWQRGCTPGPVVSHMEREEGLSAAQVYQLVDLDEKEECEGEDSEDDDEDATEDIQGQYQDQHDNTRQTEYQANSSKSEWTAIWAVVFPEEVPPRGPEHDTIMKELALLREFWTRHGRGITAGVLAERGVYDNTMASRKGTRDFKALQASVLEAMIDETLEKLTS
ncbi:hypothetical protein B0T16DRAFT_415518 [Cercophora newfieldiana]|uniref:Uncharacterized protein n=1 Tax=Cercophora newfieldiana TaxID=92897 RepID=A0AA39XZL3_9PEZI|nr:hypothetical protein B0T16DRAFT_415518 [Cercophora newfieldiana]